MALPLNRVQRRPVRVRRVASGVWQLSGGWPLRDHNHVYAIEERDGVTLFDAGVRVMAAALARVIAPSHIKRIVLGHSHVDHRGAAPHLAAPVFCHPAEVADAQGDGGLRYRDLSRLSRRSARQVIPWLTRIWDGGPVTVAGTVAEGDRVAGFDVVDLPGHAPGLIGLYRQSDRLLLAGDAIYSVDAETGREMRPGPPHPAYNYDEAETRASILKICTLEPLAVWLGHGPEITDDVDCVLARAAAE